jgi:hypothetical protein
MPQEMYIQYYNFKTIINLHIYTNTDNNDYIYINHKAISGKLVKEPEQF